MLTHILLAQTRMISLQATLFCTSRLLVSRKSAILHKRKPNMLCHDTRWRRSNIRPTPAGASSSTRMARRLCCLLHSKCPQSNGTTLSSVILEKLTSGHECASTAIGAAQGHMSHAATKVAGSAKNRRPRKGDPKCGKLPSKQPETMPLHTVCVDLMGPCKLGKEKKQESFGAS